MKALVKGFVFSFAITILLTQGVLAATITSNGSGGGDWDQGTSWTGGTAPGAADDAVIASGDVITLQGNETITSVTINSGGTLNCNGNTLTVTANFDNAGTFTDGGDVLFSGTASGTVDFTGSGSFGNFEINKTSGTDANDNLALNDGIVVAGNLTVTDGEFQPGAQTVVIGGNLTVATNGSLTAGTSTFDFSENLASLIQSNNSLTFYNVVHSTTSISGTRTLTFQRVDAGTPTFTINNKLERSGRSQGISVGANSTLSFSTATLEYSSTSQAMTVGNEWPSGASDRPTNVTFSGSQNVTLNDDRTVDGNLILDQTGGNFIVSATYTLTIDGTLERRTSGTTGITVNGDLNYATTNSQLTYNADANTTIGAEWPGTESPENVEMTITGGATLSSSGDLSRTIIEDLTINVGTLNMGSGTLTVEGTVAGSIIAGSATISDNTTLLVGNSGTGTSEYQQITGNLTLNKLTVNKTGGATDNDNTVELTGTAALTFTSNGTLTVTNGILDLGGKTMTVNTGSTLDVSGTLKTGGNTTWDDFATRTFNSGSTIEFDGTSSSETIPAGTYADITVNKTGQVATASGTITQSNNSTLLVEAGTLNLNGNTPSPGTGCTLQVDAGAILQTTNTSGDGADINLANYTKTFNGTVEFNGTTNTSSFLIPSTTFASLELNNAAGYGVAGQVTVTTTLTLTNGVITSSSGNEVLLQAGAAVAGSPGSAAHVSGPVQKQFDSSNTGDASDNGQDIPTGDGSNYRPVVIDFTGTFTSGTATFTAQLVGSDPITSNDPPSGFTDTYDDRYWSIVVSGTYSADDPSLVLDYNGYSVASPNNVRIIQGPDADGNNWALAGTYGSRSGTEVTHTGVSDFSTNTRFGFATTQATKYWVAGSGNWNTDSNWSDGVQPSPGDVVILNHTNQTIASPYTVTLNTTESIGELTIDTESSFPIELEITGASLEISGTGDVFTVTSAGTLTVNGPTGVAVNMSGNGNVIFNNLSRYNLTTGSGISTSGSVTFGTTSATSIASTNSSALKALTYGVLSLSHASGTHTVSGNVSTQNFTMTGNGSVSITGDLTVNGILDKDAGSLTVSDGTLSTTGSFSNDGGTITLSGSGSLSPGSSFSNAGTLNLNGSTQSDLTNGTFTNTGTFVVNGTGGAAHAAVSNSGGTFQVDQGAVSFSSAVTNTGTFTINSGAGTVTLQGVNNNNPGVMNLANGNAITVNGAYQGDGTISATGSGNITFASTFSPGGSATFGSQALAIQGNINVSAGTFRPSSSTTFTGTDLQISGSGAVSSTAGEVSFTSAAGQTVTDNSSADLNFYDLEIDKSSGDLTLNAPATVNRGLTLTSGNIVTTSANLLTFASGVVDGNVSDGSGSSFIDGPAAKVSASTNVFTFPVGDAGKWRRIRIEPNGTGAVTYTAELFSSDPTSDVGGSLNGLNNISTVLYWSLVRSAAVNANVRLFWEDASDGVDGDVNDLRIAQWDESASEWTDQGGTPTDLGGGAGYITAGGITNFGSGADIYFTLGSETGDNSLPVELASFEALGNFGSVTLNWSTSSEIENLGFNVYRTKGEEDNWMQVNSAMIDGQGTTSEESSYQFVDDNVVAGETYSYRLESVSLNGVVEVEETVEVFVPVPQEFALLNNYPNPFNPTTNLKFQIPEMSEVTINIYDMGGRLVKSLVRNKAYNAGEFTVQWDATDETNSRVSSGMYLYHFRAGTFSKVGKMVLLK